MALKKNTNTDGLTEEQKADQLARQEAADKEQKEQAEREEKEEAARKEQAAKEQKERDEAAAAEEKRLKEKQEADAKLEAQAKEDQQKREAEEKAERERVTAVANDQLRQEDEAKGKEGNSRTLVEVKNVSSLAQRQPSTGTWVDSNATGYLLDDGWLSNQVAAGLFKRVGNSKQKD